MEFNNYEAKDATHKKLGLVLEVICILTAYQF